MEDHCPLLKWSESEKIEELCGTTHIELLVVAPHRNGKLQKMERTVQGASPMHQQLQKP